MNDWTFHRFAQDVSPYVVSRSDGPCLSLHTVGALCLVAHLDSTFALPEWLQRRVHSTAVALHQHDGPGALWPWRGWSSMKHSGDLQVCAAWAKERRVGVARGTSAVAGSPRFGCPHPRPNTFPQAERVRPALDPPPPRPRLPI